MASTTDFEQYDHAQLRDMVRSTDGGKVLSRSAELKAAAQVLKDLSAALKSHVDSVGWEGPAAESFKTWAGNLQKSATLLGDYSDKAGDAMQQAGEALCIAQVAVPEPPRAEIQLLATANSQKVPLYTETQLGPGQSIDDFMKSRRADWVTQAQAAIASNTIEKEHREAINQMVRLAQAYDAATTALNSLPEPTLPGTPGKDRITSDDYSAGGAARTAGSGASTRSPRSSGGTEVGTYSRGGGSYSGGSVALHQPPWDRQAPDGGVHTDPISSYGGGYVTSPKDSTAPTASSVPLTPADRPGTGLDGLPTVPTPPGQSGSASPVDGGGKAAFPIGGPAPAGDFPVRGGPAPARGGGSTPGNSGGSLPGRPARFGGGALPGKTGAPGLPTGNVFGSHETQPGRAGASGQPGVGGMHPGAAVHGMGGTGGGTRGRGLTSTGGGIVGGRKGPSVSGEFTPGGTGLRRRAGAVEGAAGNGQNGVVAPGMHGGGSGRDGGSRRQRADYLQEDEETWTSGAPHSNPNVVE